MKTTKKKQNKIVENYFNRKFEFTKNSTWNLSDVIFQKDKFIIPELQARKIELNAVKEQLSCFNLLEWSKHTKSREPSTTIISAIKRTYKPELVTQAWCKFYECLSEYAVIPVNAINEHHLNSVHLCEAPGAFICALNYYLKSNFNDLEWNWLGNTLNPYYEGNSDMIPDDRLIRNTYENWQFGLDLTGDLTKYYNNQSLVNFVKVKWGKVQLVTADGSIDCMGNPGDQEKLVEHLHYCEAMTALQVLEEGGSFVIKIFTMFEESTICLMYLLNYCFEKVHVFKPCSSKSGNSEEYVICLKYIPLSESLMESLLVPYIQGKLEKSMFPLDHISTTFMKQIYDCGLFFMEKQIKAINENVKYFRNMDCEQYRYIKKLSTNVVIHFENKYSMFLLPNELKLVTDNNINCNLYNIAEHFLTKEQDFVLYSKFDINGIDLMTTLDMRIGKYILIVYHSKYHTVTNYSYNQSKKNKELYKLAESVLTYNNNIITFNDFEQFYGVSKFHRMFFRELYSKFTYNKNMLIVGVPLLTNFLVGLVFLVSLAFKKMWFLNNVIVLESPDYSKFKIIKGYLEIINETYMDIDKSTGPFIQDILFVVPFEYIYNRMFIKPISKYNDCIIKYR